MTKTSQLNPIELLVVTKYPRLFSNEAVGKIFGLSSEQFQQMHRDADAYRNELLKKTPDEIEALLAAETACFMQKQDEAKRLEAQKKQLAEKKLFFHQKSADADYIHWAKASYWSLDEAIALSFGKDPRTVRWENVKPYTLVTVFAQEYQKLHDLVSRALAAKQLSDPTYPGPFISWAKRYDINIPEELEKQLAKYGGNVADWRAAYNTVKPAYDTLQREYEHLKKDFIATSDLYTKTLEAKNSEILISNQDLDILRTQLEALQQCKVEKPLETRERETLLQIILGMAVDKYGYDAKKPTMRSDVPMAIHQALVRAGIYRPPTAETIRKKLRLATQDETE